MKIKRQALIFTFFSNEMKNFCMYNIPSLEIKRELFMVFENFHLLLIFYKA